jgi:hypothetical protein
MAVLFSLVFAFDFAVIIANSLYRSINILAVGIFSAVLAAWMIVVRRDT